ncbi:MAG TPA: homoserine kinase [Gemmatimonadaceae bacterium]|nr:homoserine kinase [Gemmatimonadaceae bacterium]
MSGAITIRVPASTSNLGAGFDCVGVAVDRWLTLTAWRVESGSATGLVRRRGTLLALAPGEGLIEQGVAAACRAAGWAAPAGIALEVESRIPIGRGLGSSAAAVVAGAAAANALLSLGLERHAIARLCTVIEGHPDNVVPAVYGGAMLAVWGGREACGGTGEERGAGPLVVAPLQIHESLALVFAVPDFAIETKRARSVLPAMVSHGTAVRAAARSAALVRGLALAHPALLAAALDDVLHVPYRRQLVPGYDSVTAAAVQAGAFGATLSGSGPTIVAVSPRGVARAVEGAMTSAWRGAGVAAETFQNIGAVSGYTMAGPAAVDS